jgi:hypothetical protein
MGARSPDPASPEPDPTEADLDGDTAEGNAADASAADGNAADADAADDLVEGDATDTAPDPEMTGAVAALSEGDLNQGERRRLLRRLTAGAARNARRIVAGPRSAARWTADSLVEIAPHIPIRDRETLRAHHAGLDGDALAEVLVRNASRGTAAIGAAGGGLAAVEWIATPSLLSAPLLLVSETIAVVAIEMKMIAELHEAYGLPVQGTGTERAGKLLTAWSKRRGVTIRGPAATLAAVLGTSARKELSERLMRRLGRNLTTLGPFLTGAAVGAELNRRATRAIGEDVRRDLLRELAGPKALPTEPVSAALPPGRDLKRS